MTTLSLRGTPSEARGTEAISEYSYDDSSKDNCVGRLSKVTDSSGSTEFFYDKLGREIKSIKSLRGAAASSVSLRGTERSPERSEGGAEAIPYVRDITYSASGQIKVIQYGNGTQTDYTYGNDLRLAQILTSSFLKPSL